MSPRSWFIIFLLSARCCLSVAKSRESSRRGGEPGRKRRSFRFSLFFSRVGRADSISITSMVYSFRLFGPMSRPIGARGSIISPIFCVCYWIAMRKLGKWRLDWRCGFPFDYFFFLCNASGWSCLSCRDWPPGRSVRKLFFFVPLYRRKVFASIPAAGI